MVIRSGDQNINKVALTFDDGPNPIYTEKILSILKEAGVMATFFLIGRNAELYPDIVRRILADGHDIGNHTYTHARLAEVSEETVRSEIVKAETVITSITGNSPVFFRPPGHYFKEPTFAKVAESLGLRMVFCSIACPDWNWSWETQYDNRILIRYKATRIHFSVSRNAGPGSIINLHDGSEYSGIRNWEKRVIPTCYALPRLLMWLKVKKNLHPVKLSEMELIEESL